LDHLLNLPTVKRSSYAKIVISDRVRHLHVVAAPDNDTGFAADRPAMEQAKETAQKIGHLRVTTPPPCRPGADWRSQPSTALGSAAGIRLGQGLQAGGKVRASRRQPIAPEPSLRRSDRRAVAARSSRRGPRLQTAKVTRLRDTRLLASTFALRSAHGAVIVLPIRIINSRRLIQPISGSW